MVQRRAVIGLVILAAATAGTALYLQRRVPDHDA